MTGSVPDEHHWAGAALTGLLDRVSSTLEQVGDRFPLYADQDTGTWVSTGRGSWTGGFWAGLLALRAAHDNDPKSVKSALAVRDRLDHWVRADTVCRGMIFWYGETLTRLELAPPSPSAALAATALAADFAPSLGVIPWGTALGGGPTAVRPDGAPGVVALLATHGLHTVAHDHLATHVQAAPPAWPRDAAWLLLATTDAAAWLDGFPEHHAERRGEHWLARFGTSMPTFVADEPRSPCYSDSSAAAIAAVALLQLSAVSRQPRWRRAACDMLSNIVREAQLPTGGIGRGCYNAIDKTATAHELVWSDYFTALGLAMLIGLAPTGPRQGRSASRS